MAVLVFTGRGWIGPIGSPNWTGGCRVGMRLTDSWVVVERPVHGQEKVTCSLIILREAVLVLCCVVALFFLPRVIRLVAGCCVYISGCYRNRERGRRGANLGVDV